LSIITSILPSGKVYFIDIILQIVISKGIIYYILKMILELS